MIHPALTFCKNNKGAVMGICVAMLAFGSTRSAMAATYFVSLSGDDNNAGAMSAPWKTIYKAITVAAAGDTVYFREGDYPVQRMIYFNKNSGVAGKPITYAAYSNEKVTFTWNLQAKAPDGEEVMLFVGRAHHVFEKLTFRQTEAARAFAISINQQIAGVSIWAANVVVRDCSVLNPSGLGIYVNGSGFLVERTTVNGMHHGHAFYIAGADGVYRDNRVDCGRGALSGHGQCLQIQYESAKHNQVHGNLVMNGTEAGVVFSGPATDNEVFNNIFINAGTRGTAVAFWCEKGPLGEGNKFFNNTVMGKTKNGMIDTRLGVIAGGCQSTSGGKPLAEKVEIRNNIFYPSDKPASTLTSISTIRDNIFFNINGPAPAGNTLVNPLLVNPLGTTAADAKLKAGSPAIDKVISGAPPTDFFKSARPSGGRADIGASEFTASNSGDTVSPNSPTKVTVQ